MKWSLPDFDELCFSRIDDKFSITSYRIHIAFSTFSFAAKDRAQLFARWNEYLVSISIVFTRNSVVINGNRDIFVFIHIEYNVQNNNEMGLCGTDTEHNYLLFQTMNIKGFIEAHFTISYTNICWPGTVLTPKPYQTTCVNATTEQLDWTEQANYSWRRKRNCTYM